MALCLYLMCFSLWEGCASIVSDHDASKAWSECARAMMELDKANIKRWKDDIDTLLVFVSLFLFYDVDSCQ